MLPRGMSVKKNEKCSKNSEVNVIKIKPISRKEMS